MGFEVRYSINTEYFNQEYASIFFEKENGEEVKVLSPILGKFLTINGIDFHRSEVKELIEYMKNWVDTGKLVSD